MRKTGFYQLLGGLDYFIPDSLPPINPSLELSPEILTLYGEATFALGQLNGMSSKLPDRQRFIKAYVVKEALLSSAIEGIHTTLLNVFTSALDGFKVDKDTQLVLNYTKALDAALELMHDQGFPLSLRVILRAHEALMSNGAGDQAALGQFRRQSVRVGNLVPPPAPEVLRLMAELEQYINIDSSDIPPLIRAGLVHVQFETIHPFLDGNGRIGRLLIVLMLIDSRLLNSPILYLSYYFKRNHLDYYQRLDQVRTQGDFEGWIKYYLTAVRDSAIDAYRRAKEIEDLESNLRDLIQRDSRFAKNSGTALLVLDAFFGKPVTSITEMSVSLNKSYNTIQAILTAFMEAGIVSIANTNKRNKIYYFDAYLALLGKEYGPGGRG